MLGAAGAECVTSQGACALPFTFDGAAYHTCAGAGAEAWCSLTPIFLGERAACPETCLAAGNRLYCLSTRGYTA